MNDTSKRYCKKCGAEMRLVKSGKRKPKYACQPCHTKAVREKYSESRDRAVKKFRKNKPESYIQQLKRHHEKLKEQAFNEIGIRSYSCLQNKKSQKDARNSRQRWIIRDDELVLSRQYTDRELGKMIGRSIKAVERRREYLLKREEKNTASKKLSSGT